MFVFAIKGGSRLKGRGSDRGMETKKGGRMKVGEKEKLYVGAKKKVLGRKNLSMIPYSTHYFRTGVIEKACR